VSLCCLAGPHHHHHHRHRHYHHHDRHRRRSFAGATNSRDGLRCFGEPAGLDSPAEEAEAEARAVAYPLVWEQPGSGSRRHRALMPHSRCISQLRVHASVAAMRAALLALPPLPMEPRQQRRQQQAGSVDDGEAAAAAAAASAGSSCVAVVEREEARMYLHTIMRRAVEPSLVYAHGWRAGDVCVWDNHAVW
jgi:hypothetical protein